jgi:hypothetical protein
MLSGPRAGMNLLLKEKFHDPIGTRPSFHRLSFTPLLVVLAAAVVVVMVMTRMVMIIMIM